MRHLHQGVRRGAVLTVALGLFSLALPAPVAARARNAVIPAAAMLQTGDLRGPATTSIAEGVLPWLRPPAPYLRFPAGVPRADRAIQALYPLTDTRPTMLVQYVSVYRGGGAQRYLQRFRQTVGGCGGFTAEGRTWRVIRPGIAGRSSLLLAVTERWEYPDGSPVTKTIYVAVARTGHAIVVVADIGWEYGDGHQSLVRELAPVAVRRAAMLG